MPGLGRIRHIYRYPVKSMAGEELASAELGWHGIKGDRRYSFVRTGHAGGFPWLTASKMPGLIRYRAYHTDGTDPSGPRVYVRTPGGTDLEVGNDSLRTALAKEFGADVSLIHVGNGIFDDFPVSLISTTTLAAVGAQLGTALDPRRFRPNLLVEPTGQADVWEDEWVGKTIVFGNQSNAPSLRISIHDVRCVMVNLDHETAESDPRVLKTIASTRKNCAGVYATVLNPGVLNVGDEIMLNG